MFDPARRILIYIPVYNCESRILGVLDDIEPWVWERAEVLVIDNRSTDNTLGKLVEANNSGRWPRQVHVIQPKINAGYSGSQKLAFRIVLEHEHIDWVLMLHGDGQYDSRLIKDFFEHIDGPNEVVYGYRSWRTYWSKDETPLSSYVAIKVLSVLESFITGYRRKEWHSGMVMYSRHFLARIDFDNITPTMHIDGHLLYAAGVSGTPVHAIPIYKRYKNYPALGPTARVRYVFNVLGLMPRLKSISVLNASCQNLEPEEQHSNRLIEFESYPRELPSELVTGQQEV